MCEYFLAKLQRWKVGCCDLPLIMIYTEIIASKNKKRCADIDIDKHENIFVHRF